MHVVFLVDAANRRRASWHATARVVAELAASSDVSAELWAADSVEPTAAASLGPALQSFDPELAEEADTPAEEPEPALIGEAALVEKLARSRARVVVSTSLETLRIAVAHAPAGAALVHWERHRQRDAVRGQLPLLASRLSRVVVGDPETRRYLEALLGPDGPGVVAIPDPVAAGLLPRTTGDSKIIVAAGNFGPESGLSALITAFGQAAGELPDWRLRIFGDGWFRSFLRADVRKHGLFDRVELPGVSGEMPLDWARGSIAVSPAWTGLSLCVSEAMAAGLAVVAFDSPDGARHRIRQDVDGLLVRPNPPALGRALAALGQDDTRRKHLGDAAREAAQEWAPAKVAQQWLDLLAHAGESRPAASRAHDATPMPAPSELTPADAVRETLRRAVSAAAKVTDDWFVLRPQRDRGPVVVIPDQVRSAMLEALVEQPGPELVVLDDPETPNLPAPAGRLDETVPRLLNSTTAWLSISVPPTHDGRITIHGRSCAVDLEFWRASGDGLGAPRPNEWVGSVRRGDATAKVSIAGLEVPTVPLAAEPTFFDHTFPIDVVYTWVDGSDPAWQQRRDAALSAKTGVALSRASSGAARFVSRDELRYSMRSLHLFAPWINHIYLVTDDQVPAWLDPGHPGLTVVSHRDILAAEHLPTFNSHAIESGLHRVPGLSEHFIYFNDDVLLARPARPGQFFTPSGQFLAFVGTPGFGDDAETALPYQRAAHNNRALLSARFGRVSTRVMRHTPHPLTRSVLSEIESMWPAETQVTASAAFRSESDISIASSLAQHVGLITGTAIEGDIDAAYIAINESQLEYQLKNLLTRRDRDSICFADHHDWAYPESAVRARLHRFLEEYYPGAAPWEK